METPVFKEAVNKMLEVASGNYEYEVGRAILRRWGQTHYGAIHFNHPQAEQKKLQSRY
jgi:hypothetical protein